MLKGQKKVKGKRGILLNNIKEVVEKDQEVLFAYLYGSSIFQSIPFDSDIDVAVYLKTSDLNSYIRTEDRLTSALITKLHKDKIDLRILNTLPLLLQYNILKEGIPIFIRDESEKIDFEVKVMSKFFELKPYLEEYKRMLSSRIEAGI
jgi:predicted nucleotidyltransferase